MLIELCPSEIRLEIAPLPVSISTTKQEFRVLESTNMSSLREATKIHLTYLLKDDEMNQFLNGMQLAYGALVSWELSDTFKNYISIDSKFYEFEPFWRFQNEPLEVVIDDELGLFKFNIYIVNVRS